MIGRFRCGVDDALFRDSGPIERAIVVFPRSSVWIAHEGSPPFVANPNVVTIYNRGQRYERRAISSDGDRCDWFAVSDAVAREIVAAFDESAAESAGVFRFEAAPSTPSLYVQQRRVACRAARGTADALALEEDVIDVVSSVMSLAYQRPLTRLARRPTAIARRRDLIEAAKAELLRTMSVNSSVDEIARTLGTSPFHLCRVFRAATGLTMHGYRSDARVRAALELLGDDANPVTLSVVAHRLGFASHSHFISVCRRHLGETPRAIRDLLSV
ncbi:MAG: helix-turn-helix transcriptional regulator [Gemmatimonadaceae bacterium]